MYDYGNPIRNSFITEQQINDINTLLARLETVDSKQYELLTDYPNARNNITWFLRQQRRGFVNDITINQGSNIIDMLKNILNEY